MGTVSLKTVLDHLGSLGGGGLSDGELLERFIECADDTAFAVLVRRHGQLVLSVCRRVLGAGPDAEDAFQATFVVLSRNAASIRKRSSLANWLHGVAHRLALQAKFQRNRRQRLETTVAGLDETSSFAENNAMPADPAARASLRELATILDQELQCLPAGSREALLLCCLENLTQADAAKRLGCPIATLKTRLQRGRNLLRQRLERRGMTLGAVALSVFLTDQARACVSATLVRKTVQSAAHNVLSPTVAALAKTCAASLTGKLKVALAVLMLTGVTAVGMGVAARGQTQEQNASVQKLVEQSDRVEKVGEPLPAGAIRRLAAPAFGQNIRLLCFVVTPDGKKLITGTAYGFIVWDIATGKPAKELIIVATGPILHLAVSPAGDFLVVGHSGGNVAVYGLDDGKLRIELDHPPSIVDRLQISPDGKLLASINRKSPSTVMLWNMAKGTAAGTLEWEPPPTPEDKMAVLEEKMAVLIGGGTGRGLTFHPNGKSIFSFDSTRIIEWDLATRKEIRQLADRPDWRIDAIAMSADGKTLAVATSEGDVRNNRFISHLRLLDPDTFKERFRTVLPGAIKAVDLKVTPNGRYLAAAFSWQNGVDRSVRLWDSWNDKRIKLSPVNHDNQRIVQFFGDGRMLVTGGGDTGLRLWNVADGTENPLTQGPTGPVGDLSFSSNGELLASSSSDGTVQLWDTVKGKYLRTLRKTARGNGTMQFSPQGATLLVTTIDLDQRPQTDGDLAKLWDVRTGECLHTFQPAYGHAAFAPDGRSLAAFAFADPYIHVWDVVKGLELRQLAHGEKTKVKAVAFSSDGRWLYSSSDDYLIRRWNIATGASVSTMSLEQPAVDRFWVSPDGSLLFAHHGKLASNVLPEKYVMDSTIDVIETLTGQLAFSLEGAKIWANPPDGLVSKNGIYTTAHGTWLTHGGATLVVATAPGKFRAIDLATGTALGPDVVYGGDFARAEFSPDGKMLALGHHDGRLLLWNPPPLPSRPAFSTDMDDAKLRSLWKALADPDAKAAYQARWLLSAAPEQSLPLFRKELRPPAVDAKEIAALIARLDSNTFKERDLAMKDLEKIGDLVEGALRKVLEQSPTLEMRQRIDLLLAKFAIPPTGETLRTLRTITILENIGSAEARSLLRNLKDAAPGSRVSETAQAALSRMK